MGTVNMSFNSPAKHERVERHLMRQRGAGVRTVSANFGFSFGLSAPPSSDATPIQEEPPAKRRKTIVQDSLMPLKKDKDVESKYEVLKTGRSRGELPVDREDRKPEQTQPAGDEDSFVFGLGKKKTRRKQEPTTCSTPNLEVGMDAHDVAPKTVPKPKKRKTTHQIPKVDVEDAIQELTAKGRPRRRAAATAAAKVTDGFVGEAARIDKKRREDESSKKAKRSRKADLVALETVRHGDEDKCVSREATALKRSAYPKRKIGRKRKGEDEDMNYKDEDELVYHKAAGMVTPSADTVAVNLKTGKKLDARRELVEPHLADKVNESITPTHGIERDEEDDVCTRASRVRPADKPRKRNVKDAPPRNQAIQARNEDAHPSPRYDESIPAKPTVGTKASQRKGEQNAMSGGMKAKRNELSSKDTQRQPLGETDINLVRPSVSPEKPVRDVHQAKPVKTKSKRSVQQCFPTTRGVVRSDASNHPKFQVQRDGDDELSRSSDKLSEALPESKDMTRRAADPSLRIQSPGTFDSAITNVNGESLSREVEDAVLNEAKAGVVARPIKVPKLKSDSAGTEPSGAEKTTKAFAKTTSETRGTVRSRDAHPRPISEPQIEEDIDWLFASGQSVRRPAYVPRQVTVARHRTNNMSDIDLDDLVSNIALIAQG